MKKLSKLTAVVLVLLLLCGCSANSYRFVYNNGDSYLVLSNYIMNRYDPENYRNPFAIVELGDPLVYFSSLREMKHKIKTGDFDENDFRDIVRFKQDAKGRIKICDIENLYEPILPDGYEVSLIEWTGEEYFFRINEYYSNITMRLLSQESADNAIKEAFEEADYIKKHHHQESFPIAPGVRAVKYYYKDKYNSNKSVRLYDWEVGDTHYYVLSNYTNGTLDETVVLGKNDTQCFRLALLGRQLSAEKVPQIGLKKYVETEVS